MWRCYGRTLMRFLKQFLNFIAASFASKFMPIASIFLFSRMMPVDEYGVLNLFASYIWIFGITMSLNLHTAIGRYVYTEKDDVPEFLGSTLVALFVLYVAGAAIVVYKLDYFSELLRLPHSVVVMLLPVVLGYIFESILLQVAVRYEESGKLMWMTAGRAIATMSIGLALLFTMNDAKYLAIMWADVGISCVFVVLVLLGLRKRVRVAPRLSHFKFMAGYSLPLIPYMLGLTILAQIDRVMIDRWFGKEATGLYSLAYNVGVLPLMIVGAAINVLTPAFFKGMNGANYDDVRDNGSAIFIMAIGVSLPVILFGEELVAFVLPPAYASAFSLIPVVAIGALGFSLFQIWVRVIAYANKTYLISAVAVMGAILNVGLNYFLLPIYGYGVAAITTLIAYGVMSVVCVAIVNRLYKPVQVNIMVPLVYLLFLLGTHYALQHIMLAESSKIALKIAILAVIVLHWRLSSNFKTVVKAVSSGSRG